MLSPAVDGLNPEAVREAIAMGARVDPRLYEIMDMAKAAGCVLATGHFARDEVPVILDSAKRIGLEKIHHPFQLPGPRVHAGGLPPVRRRGHPLSASLGQLHNAPPTEGLREFIQALREEGIGDRDLAVMTREVPARLLGLD